jgi:hypothetical protein
MVSIRCKMVVKEALNKLRLHYVLVDLGMVEVMEELSAAQREALKKALLISGLELMDDKKAMLIEKIKNVIIEMVHYSDELPKVNYSDYISLINELIFILVLHKSNFLSIILQSCLIHNFKLSRC